MSDFDDKLLGKQVLGEYLISICRIYGFPEIDVVDLEYIVDKYGIESLFYLFYIEGQIYRLELAYQYNAYWGVAPVTQFTLYQLMDDVFHQIDYYDSFSLEELVDCIQRENDKAPS